MNREMLCSWLGVAVQNWPPDPHVLLGLAPGETDLCRIEIVVHERMTKLRCYQNSHPEEATEGMNRLAQAFLCLTEQISTAKKIGGMGPRTVGPVPAVRTVPPLASPTLTPPSKDDTAVVRKTEIDWRYAPPPVRASKTSETAATLAVSDATVELLPEGVIAPAPASGAEDSSATVVDSPDRVAPKPTSSSSSSSSSSIEMVPAVVLLARQSPEARQGLGHLAGLLERIGSTRKLLRAWKQVGRYLGNSSRPITRQAEEDDLTHRMNVVFELLEDYPAFVGHPGQPGYRVAALARLEITAQMFKMLDEGQRKDLARDWKDGKKLLLEHRRFLLEKFKRVKRTSKGKRWWNGVKARINDHPLLVLGGVTVVIAAAVVWLAMH